MSLLPLYAPFGLLKKGEEDFKSIEKNKNIYKAEDNTFFQIYALL